MRRFSSDRDLASAASQEWLSALLLRDTSSPYYAALSGGRIANQFFRCVVDFCKERSCSMERVHFFWADERCVPPTDEASNFRIARELLFEPIDLAESQVHRIRGELDGAAAVEKAVSEIARLIPQNHAGQPVFDIVFLGMGEDGHVASLFPSETDSAISSDDIYRLVTATKPPPVRVTLGYAAIVAAKQVWVLASGDGKEEALRKSLEPNILTPLGRVLAKRKSTVVFTDIKDRSH